MSNDKEKKGLFGRLLTPKKDKPGSCCCGFEIEEIPDEDKQKATDKDSKEKDNE